MSTSYIYSMFYNLLQHLHSALRWLVLISLIYAVYDAWQKRKLKTTYDQQSRKPSFYAFILTHTQLLVGLLLYSITPRFQFISGMMKDHVMRFFAVEHPMMMLISIVLITIGYIKGKKAGSFGTIFWFYLIALMLILICIPWPFYNYNTHWI